MIEASYLTGERLLGYSLEVEGLLKKPGTVCLFMLSQTTAIGEAVRMD